MGHAEFGCMEQSYRQSDSKGAGQGDPVAHQATTVWRRVNGFGISVPMNEPNQDDEKSRSRTHVLKDSVHGAGAEQGEVDLFVQEMPMAVDQIVAVCKCIPEDVGSNSDEDGEDEQRKLGDGFDGERSSAEM